MIHGRMIAIFMGYKHLESFIIAPLIPISTKNKPQQETQHPKRKVNEQKQYENQFVILLQIRFSNF